MTDATISLLILAGTIVLFVLNRFPVGVVAIATALALYFTGVLDAQQALAGFGDPVVVFIAALFVVSEGIDSTGVTTWAGQKLIDRAGERRSRLLTAVMVFCAVLTALISLNGSVAALLPMVVVLATRIGVAPSQMLMPLAFAGSAGSLLLLTGSPVNVIVAEASEDAGAGGFGFVEFAIVGIPLLAGTMAISLLLGPRVLPSRRSRRLPPDLSRHGETLAREYALADGFYRLRVQPESSIIGTPLAEVSLADHTGVTLIGIQARSERHELDERDVLVVSGAAPAVQELVRRNSLLVLDEPIGHGSGEALFGVESGAVEVVVPPRSPLIGDVVFPGQLRTGGVTILGVQRRGKDRGPVQTEVAAGDTLLLRGSWSELEELSEHRDVLVVDAAHLIRRQVGPLGPPAIRAIAILAVMIVLLTFGLVPPAIAGLLAAGAMVVLRVVSSEQAYRSVSWSAIVLIGGLIPLSTAIQDSGASDKVAHVLIDVVGDGHPYLLMIALFALIAVLGQIINNTATTLIVLPIAISAALDTGISVQPVLMLVAVAGAASLLTPIATPANMMVMGPGAYRFGDYWKLGLPIMLWWLAVAIVVIPLVWRF